MTIRPLQQSDVSDVMKLWLRSVTATHNFLNQQDIDFYYHEIKNRYLVALEVYVSTNDLGQITGFIGLSDNQVDMLFVDSQTFRQGIGRYLLTFAKELKGNLTLDVNEQNPQALQFYLAQGFKIVSRTELDTCNRPFPLIRLAQA